MTTNSCLSLVKRLTTLCSLTSLSVLFSLPSTAQMGANVLGGEALAANPIQNQQLPLRATPELNLVAQVGVRSIADELVTANDAFSTLSAAVRVAGLLDDLAGRGPFTIFAPTDEAFNKLPAGTVQALLRSENRSRLIRLLNYHVVPGNINTFGLTPGRTLRLKTLAGRFLTVRVTDASEVFVNNNQVILADIPATNGTIHAINTVLMP